MLGGKGGKGEGKGAKQQQMLEQSKQAAVLSVHGDDPHRAAGGQPLRVLPCTWE